MQYTGYSAEVFFVIQGRSEGITIGIYTIKRSCVLKFWYGLIYINFEFVFQNKESEREREREFIS